MKVTVLNESSIPSRLADYNKLPVGVKDKVIARGDELEVTLTSSDKSFTNLDIGGELYTDFNRTKILTISAPDPVFITDDHGNIRKKLPELTVGFYDSAGENVNVLHRYSIRMLDMFVNNAPRYFGHFDDDERDKAVKQFNRVLKALFDCIDLDDAQATYEALKNARGLWSLAGR